MKALRRSRLAVNACPGCNEDRLVSNGAFWICDICRYAVTSTALAMDRAMRDPARRHFLRTFPRAFEIHASIEEDRLDVEPAWSGR
ncbi:MAG: hypothetical protein OJF52_000974 [Nitrospira sp.]|jgi:ribosomal protein L37AE/L43A|nr:hypothetical protein [Nitrospira sp.]WHZ14139.1 MAG: hypothetical protein OJF52_000974 [Nitrospira sp.]